jgi:hypothetical protein
VNRRDKVCTMVNMQNEVMVMGTTKPALRALSLAHYMNHISNAEYLAVLAKVVIEPGVQPAHNKGE